MIMAHAKMSVFFGVESIIVGIACFCGATMSSISEEDVFESVFRATFVILNLIVIGAFAVAAGVHWMEKNSRP